MKELERKQLIKDIVIGLITWIAFAIFVGLAMGDASGFLAGLLVGWVVAGLPFGWRWISNVVVSVSFQMLAVKFILSIVVGWVALPVTIIKDVVSYVNA